tara:strand:- start:729 stop:914 length:186 start_codon:yes stop_codon:yes gene_type:complete
MGDVVLIKSENKKWHLCSHGNKNIIQASKNLKDITKVMDDLNRIAKVEHGFTHDRFYLLEE